MATEIQPSSCSSAQITFPSRLLAIPLVSSTLDTVHSTLSTSPYTQRAYTTGSSLAHSAYTTASGYATNSALYPRILPAIAAADGYANKGFDAVHAKFPYPFENSPETMYNDLKKAPEDAKNVAYKTIDERIKTPAYGLARGVDTVRGILRYAWLLPHLHAHNSASLLSSTFSSRSLSACTLPLNTLRRHLLHHPRTPRRLPAHPLPPTRLRSPAQSTSYSVQRTISSS